MVENLIFSVNIGMELPNHVKSCIDLLISEFSFLLFGSSLPPNMKESARQNGKIHQLGHIEAELMRISSHSTRY